MAVVPDRQTFLEQAKKGNLVPVWKEILADQETPVSAYERVRTYLRKREHASHTYLLESVEGGEKVGRYSFIGLPAQTRAQYGTEQQYGKQPFINDVIVKLGRKAQHRPQFARKQRVQENR